jgi:hypothetical protein
MAENENRRILEEAIRNLVALSKHDRIVEFVFSQPAVSDPWKEYFSKLGITVYGRNEVPEGRHPAHADFSLPDEIP